MRQALGNLEEPEAFLDDDQQTVEESVPEECEFDLGSDRYQLTRLLGQGGFGEVYLAQQTEPVRRQVAIKILKSGSDSQQVLARFDAERQALAMMEHPSISGVFDAGATDEGQPYFVMEYVDGMSITDYCDAEALGIEQRLRLFIEVCEAVQHAHQKGVIHRDLKPSNIMVTSMHGAPRPKVIDFGIAKALDEPLTDRTLYTELFQLVGTPAYMSPEQADLSSNAVDTRSDVYSLGAVLYELLTGNTPFQKEEIANSSLDEVLRKLRLEDPARPSARVTTSSEEISEREAKLRSLNRLSYCKILRGDLDWITMKALAKEPGRRFESAAEFAEDIRRHLADEPIRARPPSTRYRLQKLVRRNRAAFVAAALAVLILVMGTVFSTVQAIRARQAQKVAVEGEAEYRDLFYFSNMSVIRQSWEENNLGRVRKLLEETRDYPHRGFEWFYWNKQTDLSRLVFREHKSPLTSLATFPDGKRIISADESGVVKVWDLSSGEILHTFDRIDAGVLSLAVSKLENYIVLGHGDGKASVWGADTYEMWASYLAHTRAIEGVAISHDGTWFVTVSRDRSATFWADVRRPEVKIEFKGHEDRINDVAIASDHSSVVTASWDRTARSWSPGTGKERVKFVGHGFNGVKSVAISPDARTVATGSWDRTIRLWHAFTGDPIRTLIGHTAPVTALEFSSDGKRLVSGSDDQTAVVWDVETGDQVTILKGHSNGIADVVFADADQAVITASSDGTARVWGAMRERGSIDVGAQGGWITSVAISHNSSMVLTAGGDKMAMSWNLGARERFRTYRGHDDSVTSVDYSPDGLKVLTASEDGNAQTWVAFTGKEILTIDGGGGAIKVAKYSPDGRRIATGGMDKSVKIWDAKSGDLQTTLVGHSKQITDLEFSPDGERLVSGSHDGSVRVWDLGTGKELLAINKYSSQINGVAFSSDGTRIASASDNKVAHMWDAETGEELLALLGHTAPVWDVDFSPDGERILTSSFDRTVKLWESTAGREVLTLHGHEAQVWSAQFSPDGKRIVSGGWDKKLRFWDSGEWE